MSTAGCAGFATLCDERRLDALNRLFLFLQRVSALDQLKTGFSTYVAVRARCVSVMRRSAAGGHVVCWCACRVTSLVMQTRGMSLVSDPEKDKSMIQSLLDLRDSVDVLVEQGFYKNDMLFYAAKAAFEKFMNTRDNRPAELIGACRRCVRFPLRAVPSQTTVMCGCCVAAPQRSTPTAC
jgi:hypothetical protein